MTDKQIIIDSCDVSGCEYIIPPHEQCPNKPMPYAKETSCFACKENNTKLNFCKNNPNCYYKQLKRSEAQCEAMFVSHTDLEKKYKAKEQECEELKDKLNCCFCNPYIELNDIEKQRKCVEVTECFRRQLDQLKLTLAEIKEIAEHCIKQDICTTCDNCEKCHIEDKEIPTYDVCKLILQKISEVIYE